MKKTLLLLSFLGLCLLMFSCVKHDSSTVKNALAITDSSAVCGVFIKLNSSGTVYNPINLPDDYTRSNLKIVISYHLLDSKFYCVSSFNTPLQEIYIDAIRKQ